MTIEEAFAKHDQAVEDFVEGARLGVGLEAMCALEEDEERTLRELMLAVHVEACRKQRFAGAPYNVRCGEELANYEDGSPCGRWLCDAAKALKELAS